MKADLASVQSADEESFITRNIRSSIEYSTSSIYWLGGHVDSSDKWMWTDNSPMEFSAWAPDDGTMDNSVTGNGQQSCLAVRWQSYGAESEQSSGLYWTREQCKKTGGYVCKKRNEVGPTWTRMVVTFNKLDLEPQTECLYDFIELRSGGAEKAEVRWCGSRASKSDREHFVSDNNEALLRFHSDYSTSGSGFSASWRAIDVTSCPSQKLTAREGIVTSPNYGEFLLPRLDCTTTILAPPGKRIWLEFTDSDVSGDAKRNQKDAVLEIDLGGEKTIRPFRNERSIGDGNFISLGEKMSIRLKTGDRPRGIGFRALYRTVGAVHEERVLELTEDTEGFIHHLNYPTSPPPYIDFIQHLIAPMGYVISLDFHQVTFSELGSSCPDGSGIIEVNDNYDEANKTWRFLCQIDDYTDHFLLETPRVSITSFFNSLHIRQRSSVVGVKMNVTVKVMPDVNFRLKLIRSPRDGTVESCHPNPCQNGGKCVKRKCECIGHFTGMFCALTHCDLQPCDHGQCELTETGYRCRCHTGYTGQTCDVRLRPCALNPCEGRGECIDNEKTNTFHCRCHAWWEGPRCEKKMMHIPFKPLSERMLQEPFWLGLITVFVVLGVIGIVWCAKRHFPEKLEKLLAEEADKHGRSNVSGSIRQTSVREQVIASSGAVPVPSPQGTANCPRTLFGRLGIRKSSILSLTSPHRQDGANSRTFSLDDLLRPSPRRTPSPRKKRTNSTPTKKNPSEKKQILQQLISPSSNPSPTAKVHFDELILLNEHGGSGERPREKEDWRETSFSKTDPKSELCKLEKKVTFARLLNKVSAEMSSGSEVENTSSGAQPRAVSTPASPATDRKCSHSMSSNQGSDSLSGSEIAISGSAGNSLLDIPDSTRRPTKLLSNRGMRNSSADSILAMFRNFTSTSNMSRMSPTSTISSPQDDRGISDDSSAVETPVSTSSGLDSPLRRATTIDVQVMDPLTAQKTVASNNLLQPPSVLLEIPSGGVSKCLSPIHEVPTPMSSPALTPILPRTEPPVKIAVDTSDEECGTDDGNDSENSSEILIEIHQEDAADTPSSCDIKILCSSPVPEKARPPVLTLPQKEPPQNLVIPILTVQEPSPTSTSPPCSFLGSPPPQKAMDTFIFVTESSPRKCFKEMDKPNSLDLPYPPPMITITCNSGVDSDTESISPAKNSTLGPHAQGTSGMCYLSPFSMGSRADRTASESNLSSSGYSSMASPGPSRCGSNNPLCLSEVEDHQQSHSQPPSRRPSPLLRTPLINNAEQDHHRGRSDSETLSDDPLMESNDEGIGTDHLDEKIEEGDLKSARELELYLGKEQNFMDFSALAVPSLSQKGSRDCITPPKASLQLPTIIVQSDYSDKLLSPVSSRSESPLSDKTLGLGRFSPMFYSKTKNDPLPFTDSDGLYDFPSSDCIPSNNKGVQAGVSSHRKSTGRRRERRSSYRGGSKASSPTAVPSTLLDIPARDATVHRCQRKPSPKRRVRNQQPLSSSSSTESLHSANGMMDSEDWSDAKTRNLASNEASGEETGEVSPRLPLYPIKSSKPP
ncbi:UNVERIFIED_CONTAM: hypothetical protein PYX00_008110 [Menopon gallinae]|uniref:Uncharacterized protein n=1 Tax=Menopon gallinae TaxID=328185 RepID=A0AAW2HLI6_9NEOP